MDAMTELLRTAARADRAGVAVTRVGLVVVLVWIGGLKAFAYEDEGIVPFVANSPLMSFFYREPAGDYRHHMNREGELVPANREWHRQNGTYLFAYALGSVIVALRRHDRAAPVAARQVAAVGSFLVFAMSFVTLSFLVTTPESWVPPLGGPDHGFPLLSGAGRLVVKDAIMAGAALVTMADSAKAYLRKRRRGPGGGGRRARPLRNSPATPKEPTMSATLVPKPPTVLAPPFTLETATLKVRLAEDAWNSRDPERVALAYTEDSAWRNRDEFLDRPRRHPGLPGRQVGAGTRLPAGEGPVGLHATTAWPSASSTSGTTPPAAGPAATATNCGSSTSAA